VTELQLLLSECVLERTHSYYTSQINIGFFVYGSVVICVAICVLCVAICLDICVAVCVALCVALCTYLFR
jgi:hypothetical protein